MYVYTRFNPRPAPPKQRKNVNYETYFLSPTAGSFAFHTAIILYINCAVQCCVLGVCGVCAERQRDSFSRKSVQSNAAAERVLTSFLRCFGCQQQTSAFIINFVQYFSLFVLNYHAAQRVSGKTIWAHIILRVFSSPPFAARCIRCTCDSVATAPTSNEYDDDVVANIIFLRSRRACVWAKNAPKTTLTCYASPI